PELELGLFAPAPPEPWLPLLAPAPLVVGGVTTPSSSSSPLLEQPATAAPMNAKAQRPMPQARARFVDFGVFCDILSCSSHTLRLIVKPHRARTRPQWPASSPGPASPSDSPQLCSAGSVSTPPRTPRLE